MDVLLCIDGICTCLWLVDHLFVWQLVSEVILLLFKELLHLGDVVVLHVFDLVAIVAAVG